jgi:hypothetical protein
MCYDWNFVHPSYGGVGGGRHSERAGGLEELPAIHRTVRRRGLYIADLHALLE